jgi:soluble lytic murein transglycosylase
MTPQVFRIASRRAVARAAAAAAFVLATVAGPARGAPSDAEFLAARNAFERGDRAKLAVLAAPFAGNLLEPYTAYWQLKLNLDAATRDDVRRYWERWPDTPLADRLRVEWLKVVGKRGDWATFALDYPPAAGEDTELQCFGIQYHRQRDGEGALAEAKPLWFTGKATPDSCGPLFTALIQSGGISVADRRARFRLAIEAGNFRLAQAIAADLPREERISAKDFARVDRDPGRALASGDFVWARPSERELALYALERAARADPVAARASWVKYRPRLPEADRRYGNGRLAYHAARQLVPLANDWFREADGVPLDEAASEWRVRAALRAGAWPDVLAGIDAMPPALAQERPWRYWKARALAALGRSDEAKVLYLSLAQENRYYGLLARESLGMAAVPGAAGDPLADPPPPPASALAAFGARANVQRAVRLAGLGMKLESLREWIYAIRGRDDDGLLVAAEYARQQKLYDRAINTAERTVALHDFSLRYLMPYREYFVAAARANEIDEAILLSIARQESRFANDIVSSAGAIGLMQLMPPTARWVARQLGRDDYRPSQIGEVATNTQFGAFYFKYWLDRLDGIPALATAAYNAGPRRAQAWRPGAPLEGAIWVETIPFNETRDYVKKVLANAMFYASALNQPYLSLYAWLGTIPPRDDGGSPALVSRAE